MWNSVDDNKMLDIGIGNVDFGMLKFILTTQWIAVIF